MSLIFPREQYEMKSVSINGTEFSYRCWKDLWYAEKPVSDIQKLSVYAAEALFEKSGLNGYTESSAPIFLPNRVGGYEQGFQDEPALLKDGQANASLSALINGLVVVCFGIRGRSTKGKDGAYVGKAPSLIVDMKAVIRYIRFNRALIPGNTERMITSGTSAGGSLSALAACTGNSDLYKPYLDEIGAMDERDDVFAANCYCPIINLENASEAYEWQFEGIDEYCGWTGNGSLTEEEKRLSKLLKSRFPAYLNSLSLKDESGAPLVLNEDGTGSFLKYMKDMLIKSAQKALSPSILSSPYLTIQNNTVTDLNLDLFLKHITRMKTPPAFDNESLSTPENDVFADHAGNGKHFSPFAKSLFKGEFAPDSIVKMINPLPHIASCDVSTHVRIRHGSFDRDTSFAIPIILYRRLCEKGINVDFHMPWGIGHAGDYDLDELFFWIHKISGSQDLL